MDSKELKKYIYDNDKIEYVLEQIGMHSITSYGDYIVCGFPDGDNSKACTVFRSEYINIKSYTRKIENAKGFQPDLVDLVQFLFDSKPLDAMLKLANIVGLNTSISKKQTAPVALDGLEVFRKAKRKRDVKKFENGYDISVLNAYDKVMHLDMFRKDWIMPDILEKYDVRFDYESDRIVFPHFKHDDKNVVLAVIGRTVNPAYEVLKIPKYLTILGVGYNKSHNLYGLSHNIDEIKKQRKIIIFESEKSVMKADMMGYGFGVSVGCHDLSIEQIKLILSLGVDEVIFAFDKDVTAEHMRKYADLLKNYTKVTYLYDEHGILGAKDAPVDKGLKKFRFMYNYRKEF